uniref:Uncharacterized protein n=1 Tax=Triticum urartu TaxID=4572 RepID=A0A8R7PBN0_TRIUA
MSHRTPPSIPTILSSLAYAGRPRLSTHLHLSSTMSSSIPPPAFSSARLLVSSSMSPSIQIRHRSSSRFGWGCRGGVGCG